MRRSAFIAAIVGAVLVSALALANAGPPSVLQMMRFAYGSPTRLGVITSAGASTTNATTAATFTVPSGAVIEWACDAVAFCAEASACSTTLAGTSGCIPNPINVLSQPFTMKDSASATTTIACAGGGAFNCTVFQMK